MVIRAQSFVEDRAPGGKVINGSLNFNEIGWLQKDFSSDGSRTAMTFSFWYKPFKKTSETWIFGTGNTSNPKEGLQYRSTGQFSWDSNTGGSANYSVVSAGHYDDVNSWYHVVYVYDSANSTATDRIRLYINGERLTDTTGTDPSSGEKTQFMNDASYRHFIGTLPGVTVGYVPGKLSDWHFIDGQALDASYFGFTDSLTGTWRPKKLSYSESGPGDNIDNWVSMTAGSPFNSSTTIDEAFDGASDTFAAATTSGYFTFTPTTAITGITNVRLTVQRDSSTSSTIELNDVDISSSWSAGATDTVTFARTTLSKLKWGTDGSNQWFSVAKIEVEKDGTYYTLIHGNVNSYHLPFDGNSPIGEDKTVKGNDWLVWKLGNSVSIDKATGAFPIWETTSGGNTALARARGNIGVGVTVYNDGSNKYYLDGVQAGTVKFVPGQTITFDTSDSTVGGHPFRISGVSNGAHADNYYSVDFDGSGDYLSIAQSTDWLFEEGDFTIEFWAYIDAIATDGGIVTNMDDFNSASQYNSRWVIGLYNSELRVWLADDGAHVLHDYNPPQQEWVHYAITRETGNSFTLYKNGLNIFRATQTCDLDTNGDLRVGDLTNLGTYNGKISDLRIVKGTAVYTSNFCPPFSPLTNISNTKVLCCNSSTTTGYTVSPGAITANGDPAVSNDNPYDTYPFATVTSGSEGSAGAATTITIPHNSPSNLYYYCTQHSGMGGTIGIGVSDQSIADTYAHKNVLALPLTDFDTGGSDLIDLSNQVNCGVTTSTYTYSGTSAGIGSTQAVFYRSSLKFDGNGDYLNISSTDKFAFGNEDVTLEMWAWAAAWTHSPYFMDFRTSGSDTGTTNAVVWYIPNSTGHVNLWMNGSQRIYADTPFPLDQWVHVALVRKSNVWTMYQDGILQSGTWTDSVNFASTPLTIGQRQGTSSQSWNGFLSDVRIYKGIAKYTRSFNPPATPTNNSIQPDTPSGDFYPTELEQTDAGALSFNGINSLLTWDDHADFDMSTEDFCQEFWVYPLQQNSGHRQNILGTNTDWGNGYFITQISHPSYPGRAIIWWYYDGTYTTAASNRRLPENKWSHVAFIRAGNTFKIFIDGRLDSTTTITNPGPIDMSLGGMEFGRHLGSDKYLEAHISNFRVVKGSQVYTQDFIPSRKPLENITGTKLLFCQDPSDPTAAAVTGSSIVNGMNATGKTITANGNAALSASTLYMTGAVSFDGTDDYLEIPDSDDWDLGETWTIEAWVYFESLDNYDTVVAHGQNGWYLSGVSGGKMQFYDFDGGDMIESANSSVSNTTWTHVALVNNSGTAQWYVNGTASGSTASINASNHSATLQIGSQGGAWDCDGKVSNLRIVKGRAVYTSSFTAPQHNLEWTTETKLLCCRSATDITASGPSRTVTAVKSNLFDNNINAVMGERSRYAILSTLNPGSYGSIKQGGLQYDGGWSGGNNTTRMSDLGAPPYSGKWYCEYWNERGTSPEPGVARLPFTQSAWDTYLGGSVGTWMYYSPGTNTGYRYSGGTAVPYGDSYDVGDVIGMCLDTDKGELRFTKNGIDQGVAYSDLNDIEEIYSKTFHFGAGAFSQQAQLNFGQKPFVFPPPEGYKTLCTANLPVNIVNPKQYVGVSTWTGNETAGRQIYLDFQPDLILGKARNDSTNWFWTDSVRGSYKFLYSNTYGAEATTANILNIDDANDAGFKLGSSGSLNGTSAYNYFAYAFKAGGNKNTFNVDDVGYASASDAGLSAATNNLTLTGASVGTKQGFSIISYTSVADPGSTCTFAHGLSKKPELLIVKDRDGSSNIDDWGVYYTANGTNTNWITLNDTDPQGSNASGETLNGVANVYANLASDRVYISSNSYANANNADGRNMIAYAWHSVEGFSRFGVYEGNAVADGMYIYLGFRPAILILMDITSGSNWATVDTTRSVSNPNQKRSRINTTDSEGNVTWIDINSEGFKCTASSFPNTSGKKFLYMAWADSPVANKYGGHANSR